MAARLFRQVLAAAEADLQPDFLFSFENVPVILGLDPRISLPARPGLPEILRLRGG